MRRGDSSRTLPRTPSGNQECCGTGVAANMNSVSWSGKRIDGSVNRWYRGHLRGANALTSKAPAKHGLSRLCCCCCCSQPEVAATPVAHSAAPEGPPRHGLACWPCAVYPSSNGVRGVGVGHRGHRRVAAHSWWFVEIGRKGTVVALVSVSVGVHRSGL